MSGAVEGVAPIQRDENGEAMVCTGCGTTRTVAAIVADSATAFTCCPERKMIPARTMWHAWCDANDTRPALTTPPARSYADEDVARIIDPRAWQDRDEYMALSGRVASWDTTADSLAKAAAIRLLSQGGKA